MSDPARYDAAWAAAVARTRGVELRPEEAAAVAATVAPTLSAFADIADGLAIDDDMYAFRRLLADERGRA